MVVLFLCTFRDITALKQPLETEEAKGNSTYTRQFLSSHFSFYLQLLFSYNSNSQLLYYCSRLIPSTLTYWWNKKCSRRNVRAFKHSLRLACNNKMPVDKQTHNKLCWSLNFSIGLSIRLDYYYSRDQSIDRSYITLWS